jgi:hypothetical protein
MSSDNESVQLDDRRSYFFHGKFIPERVNIRLNYIEQHARLVDREVRFSVFAHESNFNGRISSNVPFESNVSAHSTIYGLLRSIVDRLSYLNLCGYDVDVVGVASTAGPSSEIFGVYEPVFFNQFDEHVSFVHKKIPFADELINLKFHDIRLDHALRCFCHEMRDDAMTPLFCYIAIEV